MAAHKWLHWSGLACPAAAFTTGAAPNAGGYVLDARDWPEQHILHLVETVQYTKENG